MTNYAVKTFITEEEFICKFLNPGIPYEGFIVGMGYAFTRPKSLLPPNNNGQVHIRNIPANGTFALLCYEQCIDNSPEAIKLSLKGNNKL